MEFVRKNLVAIILAVVSLLAIAALFWPIGGMYDDLQSQLKNHATVDNQLHTLLTAQRQMPLLNLDLAEAPRLDAFPVDEVLQKAVTAVGKIADAAKKLTTAAGEANKHGLLVAGELPNPTETQKFEFAQDYVAATTKFSAWRGALNAGNKPTEDDIKKAQDVEHEKQKASHVTYITDMNGVKTEDPQSLAQADAAYAAIAGTIRPGLVAGAATTYSIYLEDDALSFDTSIQVGAGASPPGPDKIWDAQLSFWVTTDVLTAIKRANDLYADPAQSGGQPVHDVLHDPVKRLLRMDPPTPIVAKTSQSTDESTGVTSLVAKEPTVSPSGRVCNSLYDVVGFNLDLIVDAAKVPQVIRELQAGQFISVLNVQQTEIVDPATAAIEGFVYGDKPVIHLQIQCEELFMRAWTGGFEPDSRKVDLGVVSTAAPQ